MNQGGGREEASSSELRPHQDVCGDPNGTVSLRLFRSDYWALKGLEGLFKGFAVGKRDHSRFPDLCLRTRRFLLGFSDFGEVRRRLRAVSKEGFVVDGRDAGGGFIGRARRFFPL